MYLTTYINAVDPIAAEFDGFLLQGRAGAGVPIEGWDPATINATEARRARLAGRDQIRTDGRVPVMVVQSEFDVLGTLAYLPARQPDHDRFRLWEVAGASHCDTYFMCAAPHDSGSLPVAELAELIGRRGSGMPTELPINSGPQMHYVLQRPSTRSTRTRTGTAPPSAPRLDVGDDGVLAVDDLGIGRGGVRTPWVDAPAVLLSGLGQPGYMMELFGTSATARHGRARGRYPRREQYVEEFGRAAAAIEAGFLLPADAARSKRSAPHPGPLETAHLTGGSARRPKIASSFVCNGASSGTGTGGANKPVSWRCSAIGSVRSYTRSASSASSVSSAPIPRARSHEWMSASVVISQQYSAVGFAPADSDTVPSSAPGAPKAADEAARAAFQAATGSSPS
jgi:hypothetical protein